MAEELRRAEVPYRFRIPADLIPKLRSLRARQHAWRELIEAEDVVHLYYGLGPALFLTFDGRVLRDNWDWDGRGAYEVSDPKEAWTAVVLGAHGFAFPELLLLLPQRPPNAVDCPVCGGAGALFGPPTADGKKSEHWLVCSDRCGGVGWILP
jgi:hypothetical protein